MRPTLSIALATFAVLCTPPLFAQQPEFAAEPGVPHVAFSFDPQHGVIQATPSPSLTLPGRIEPEATTSTTYTGTIVIAVNIKLVSPLVKGAVLRCGSSENLEYIVREQVSTNAFSETFNILTSGESVDATISGTTATCRFNVPYSWVVPASSTKQTVTIQGIVCSVGVSEYALGTEGQAIRTYRSTSVILQGPTTIPADGAVVRLVGSTVL